MFPEPATVWEKILNAVTKWQRPGLLPAAGTRLSLLRNYASTIATISCVRGLMITIWSPTRM